MPNKIKISLEKGKEIENNWNNNKLISLINSCLNIENNIKEIKLLNENIIKTNSFNIKMRFFQREEEGVNKLLDTIKIFGKIIKSNKFDSNIEFDEELIESWLNNKEYKTELLYRKTRDGSKPNDFHSRCDNKGITIAFIETAKRYKFGGYTELSWDKSGKHKKDESTFIFSFNNKQKYTSRNDNDSIGCGSNYGPWFGCTYPEIFIYESLDKGESSDNPNCTFIQGRKLTNGEQNWNVKELEVHKIIYI